MNIAIASGKGGTGKTMVATSLALSLAEAAPAAPPPLLLDCDVEGPNAHLFVSPTFQHQRAIAIQTPRVDASRCTGCGRCAEVCEFHAIVLLGKRVLVLDPLCHGCGSCPRVCPEGAIREEPRIIGTVEAGTAARGMRFARGILNVGEPMATPIIRELKRWAAAVLEPDGSPVILDAPPGTSCPVVETVRGADYVILVTEPTPFGLHDLRLAVELTRELGIPAGVLINRDGIGDAAVEEYCAQASLPILWRIPFERPIAEAIAQGSALVEARPEYAPVFRSLFGEIQSQVSCRPQR